MESFNRSQKKLGIFYWALYDFANTIYTMNVVTLYFPLVITVNLAAPDIVVSVVNSISMILVITTLPIFGVFSDRLKRRVPFMMAFTILSVLATATIGLLLSSHLPRIPMLISVCLFFIMANYGYQGGLVFYNTLLSKISKEHNLGKISGLGVALGYIGSAIGMFLVLPFNEGKIGSWAIPFISAGGRGATFIPTAILFAIFAAPAIIYFWEKHPMPKDITDKEDTTGSVSLILETVRDSKKYPGIRRFMCANFLFNDGIQTAIIFMAVFAQKVMKMSDTAKTGFFIFSIIGAFFGSMLFGYISDRSGYKKTLLFILTGWVISLFILAIFPSVTVFWILGIPIGAFLGGTWTTARPLVVELSPKGMEGRYFGLYAFSGKVAAIFGPILWGTIIYLISPFSENLAYRTAVFAMALLIALGAFFLTGVKKPENHFDQHP